MNFLSLPDDFKIQIFKELKWKSLMNLKLVCRDFYFAIEENIQLLDRPNVTCIRICYTKNKLSAADFDLKSTKNTMKGGTLKHVEFSNDFEYENFLKNKDFNEVRNLYLHNRESGTNILVCNSSFFIRSLPMYVSTVSLLNDESSSLPLFITISSTSKLEISYNNFLRMKSLRKFGLFEKNESNLLIKKIIMDILSGNPLLQYKSTSTDTIKTIFIQILNHLNQHGFFNLKNRCNGKDVKLHFKGVGELTVLEKEFIRKLYDKKKIKNGLADEINDNGYYLEDSIKCLKCGKEHKYSIRCDIHSRELYIGSDL